MKGGVRPVAADKPEGGEGASGRAGERAGGRVSEREREIFIFHFTTGTFDKLISEQD